VAFEVTAGSNGIPVADAVETEAKIGDTVVVLGNPSAAGVVTSQRGKLLGIGPNRIEIDAQFERGNSGSPIIHLESGKVIGVATYAMTDELINGRKEVRRFGYRLDSARRWELIDWGRFYAQADTMEKIEKTSEELIQAFKEIQSSGRSRTRRYAYDTAAVRDAIDDFYTDIRAAQRQQDVDAATSGLLASMQTAAKRDVAAVKPSLTYDYFKRQLQDEELKRKELSELFEKVLKK